jgi:NAD(P)-dependent dehydrogenase (short-subunit alcohol dehydrogenase family)
VRFDDKVVLITGAASGIGAATARYLCVRGARVALAGVPKEPLLAFTETLRDEGAECIAITTDVRREDDVAAAFAQACAAFGQVDVTIASAGIQRHQTDHWLHAMPLEEWERTQDVNLRGVVRTCKHSLKHMVERGGGGAIIIIGSITGISGMSPNVSYSTSKAGLFGLNRNIAVHYGKYGIRCNIICPGALEQTPDWDDHPNQAGRKKLMEQKIPLGRLGTAEEIAPFIALLASDAGGYANGAEIVIDGGLTSC